MKENGVATTLKIIGIVEVVCGILVGLILLGDLEWGSIAIMIASFITCMMFIGFAEIINLLQKTADTQNAMMSFLEQQATKNVIVEPHKPQEKEQAAEPHKPLEKEQAAEPQTFDAQQQIIEELRQSLQSNDCSEQMKLFLEQASKCTRVMEIEKLWKSFTWENSAGAEAIDKKICDSAMIERLYGYSTNLLHNLIKDIESTI